MIPLTPGLVASTILLSLAIVLVIVHFRIARAGLVPRLRPLLSSHFMYHLTDQAIEEGRRTHLALGTGRLGEPTAAEMLMGLIALDEMAEQSLRFEKSPIATTADPASQLLAADQLARGEAERGWATRTDSRFVAPQSIAYAAGTRGMMQRESLGLTAVVGHLGVEYLLLAAEQPASGKQWDGPEVAATAALETQPLLYLTAKRPLLGEEIFAIGAYIGRWPAHLAGILLQDVSRLLLVLAIGFGVILRTLGIL